MYLKVKQQQLHLTTSMAQFGGSHSAPWVESLRDTLRRRQTVWLRGKIVPRGPPLLARSTSKDQSMSTSFPISSEGVDPLISSLTRASLRDKAEEIMNRLDREEPLLSDMEMHPTIITQPSSLLTQQNQQRPSPVPLNSVSSYRAHHRPMSLPSNYSSSSFSHQTMPHDDYRQQMMLTPIVESPGMKDTSPNYPAKSPLSHHSRELPQFSSFGYSGLRYDEFHGPGGQNSMATADSAQVTPPWSLKEQATAVFPKQKILYRLKSVSLCVSA